MALDYTKQVTTKTGNTSEPYNLVIAASVFLLKKKGILKVDIKNVFSILGKTSSSSIVRAKNVMKTAENIKQTLSLKQLQQPIVSKSDTKELANTVVKKVFNGIRDKLDVVKRESGNSNDAASLLFYELMPLHLREEVKLEIELISLPSFLSSRTSEEEGALTTL